MWIYCCIKQEQKGITAPFCIRLIFLDPSQKHFGMSKKPISNFFDHLLCHLIKFSHIRNISTSHPLKRQKIPDLHRPILWTPSASQIWPNQRSALNTIFSTEPPHRTVTLAHPHHPQFSSRGSPQPNYPKGPLSLPLWNSGSSPNRAETE